LGVEAEVAVVGAVELAVEAVGEPRIDVFAGLFDLPDAEQTPMSGGHLTDEEVVEVGLGLEDVVEPIEEFVEVFAGFSFAYDGAGEGAPGDGFADSQSFSLGGDGATGASSVGSGCGFLFFGSQGKGSPDL